MNTLTDALQILASDKFYGLQSELIPIDSDKAKYVYKSSLEKRLSYEPPPYSYGIFEVLVISVSMS